ncbi:polysaccharide deacetylase family protein [Niveibacterium sp. SC-1]|uniref:polysaccharide deacetylase family protein n=1 Tax=Niveibacterium sp. SC-1 TaxID=3135646 RepID=UPI00311ECABE
MLKPFFSLLSPAGPRARLSILIFHRVLSAPDPMFPGEMHAQRFDEMLGWLGRWFNVLPLSLAVKLMQEGRLPSRAAAITFDDGYADNLDVAAPILSRHRMHASFFISTGFLDGGRMWNDGLIEAVRRTRLEALDAGEFGRYPLSDWQARRAAAEGLIDRIKYLEPAMRLAAVEQVARAADSSLPGDLMMSSDQVARLHQLGFEIGAHTIHHPILARVSEDEAREEISRGRATLESLIQAPVRLFAYPNGKPGRDYAAAHVRMVRQLGFDAAVSTAWGASRQGDDVFQLRRFTPWDFARRKFGVRMARNLLQPASQALA